MEKIINSNSIVIACRCKLPISVLVCVYICMLCNAEIPVVKDSPRRVASTGISGMYSINYKTVPQGSNNSTQQ